MHFTLGMISYPEFMGIMNKGSCCHSHCKSVLKKKKKRRKGRKVGEGEGTRNSCIDFFVLLIKSLRQIFKVLNFTMLQFCMISNFYHLSKCGGFFYVTFWQFSFRFCLSFLCLNLLNIQVSCTLLFWYSKYFSYLETGKF